MGKWRDQRGRRRRHDGPGRGTTGRTDGRGHRAAVLHHAHGPRRAAPAQRSAGRGRAQPRPDEPAGHHRPGQHPRRAPHVARRLRRRVHRRGPPRPGRPCLRPLDLARHPHRRVPRHRPHRPPCRHDRDDLLPPRRRRQDRRAVVAARPTGPDGTAGRAGRVGAVRSAAGSSCPGGVIMASCGRPPISLRDL
ncbi:hypothetical protein SGPA1_12452 [Streptomyces misionensis JCM 4497]